MSTIAPPPASADRTLIRPSLTDPLPQEDPTYRRLEEQIAWYNDRSAQAKRNFTRMKIVEIVAAALIPFLAALNFRDFVWLKASLNGTIAALGVLITILEGFLHLNQYQQLWSAYRSTCEALRHEKYAYIGNASPYTKAADPHALLAERTESLVSQEHARWNSLQQQAGKPDAKN
jgi:Protein of unknown function (DUF4231)